MFIALSLMSSNVSDEVQILYVHSTATDKAFSSDSIYSSGIYQQNDIFTVIETTFLFQDIGFIDSGKSNHFILNAMSIILTAFLVSAFIIVLLIVFTAIVTAKRCTHVNCGQPQGIIA